MLIKSISGQDARSGGADQGGYLDFEEWAPNGTGGNYAPDGSLPYAALVQGTNGLLYGTAVAGGANGDGTVFRMSTNGTVTSCLVVEFRHQWLAALWRAGPGPGR